MLRPSRLLISVLFIFIVDIFSVTINITAKTTRQLEIVSLPAGYMEIVRENTCSNVVLRLTCRSLRAFVFVLEAQYYRDESQFCDVPTNRFKKIEEEIKGIQRRMRENFYQTVLLRGNYIKDENDEEEDEDDKRVVDMRPSFNRRCSGHHHCRFTIAEDHPSGFKWQPANVRLKYACIPDAAVRRYCNMEVMIDRSDSGYIKSPGYPLYYPGEYSCGWTFETVPGQRISLVFHDLNIRSPEPDGHCVDLVRIRDDGITLFESCGTRIGVKIISNTNRVTLDLISSSKVFTARGFLVKYEAIGCPEAQAPNGSVVSNDTVLSRTFECRSGTIFPDTRQRTRTLDCRRGQWNESVDSLPNCIASSAVILKSETDNNRLSNDRVRIGRIDDADARYNLDMDSAPPAMVKQADYVIDVLLPTILIALLFVGNAVIVYIIFQYRKRKVPATSSNEEMALRPSSDVPRV